jgi:TolB-like protein/tetratricopeptide (TPR) repeat protein
MSFINELKRRNVVRMGLLYIIASWVVLQIADVIFDPLGVPAWVFRLMMASLALGFPFALVFSWIFELTSEGIKRERDIDRSQSIVRETGNRMNFVIVLLLVLAIGGLLADRLIPRSGSQATPVVENMVEAAVTEDQASIAVLPFVNMSGDKDNEYFSDGLTEELLNALVRLGGLKVTGRTSSFAFKGQNQDLREVGRLLNVANVLEGSVRKAGNRVRITAQLVKTSDGYHLWSETFDRELDDIFKIQAEIADQVSKVLHVTLLGEDVTDPPVVVSASQNAEAFEQHLRGMYVLQRDNDGEESLEKAKDHFLRALELDPGYTEAYWGLFSTWNRINRNGYVPYSESGERMGFYAAELHKQAPGSDIALIAAGRLAIRNYQYKKAVAYMGEAASRYPGSAEVQSYYSQALMIWRTYLTNAQDFDEADKFRHKSNQAIELAGRLDPLSLSVMQNLGSLLFRQGDCPGLERLLERALDMDPAVGRFRFQLASCLYIFEGDRESALSVVEKEPLGYARDTLNAILYHQLGDPETAQRHLDSMIEDYGDSASYQYGQVYAQWGEFDKAFKWLEKAVDIHDPGIILSAGDPYLDPLRDKPRFQGILRSAGF